VKLRSNFFFQGLGSLLLVLCGSLRAQSLTVRYPEGTGQGFLVLRTPQGEAIATGDLTQTVHGGRTVVHLVFHFKDWLTR
jgi:hypothetical protein